MAATRNFTPDQVARYARHLILPEVGGKGQRKLLAAKVLLIGAGGLGSPTALYLAAAGVGTLGINDFDVVDMSNLQRQILHRGYNVGKPKTQSAAETIADLNPDVKVVQHNTPITSDAAGDIFFGLLVTGSNPLGLTSGVARIGADGTGSSVAVVAGTTQVATKITEVNRGATETGTASSEVLRSAEKLSTQSNLLKTEVDRFLETVRAA